MHNTAKQRWLLFGTAPASEDVWGLRKIGFPCGYFMPEIAFAGEGEALNLPGVEAEIWALGGFAMEIGIGGKHVPKNEASKLVSGYRPWLGFYYPALLNELEQRNHTTMIWDRGVSIFYGMWREKCQKLGDLITVAEFDDIFYHQAMRLELETGISEGSAPNDYEHSAESIVSFMSEFMTLSSGDLYVQGPLVARKITGSDNSVAMVADNFRFETALRRVM